MKKLFQINSVINYGSTGRIVEEIGAMVKKNNWESYVAFGRSDRASTSTKIKIGTKRDLIYHGIQTRLFDRHGFGSKRATSQMIEKIDEIKPNIIHLHNLHGYYININLLFQYLSNTNIPIVWTLHDCWPITGHCAYFDLKECERWKTHCEKCPNKREYPASYLFDNSYNNFKFKKKLFTSLQNVTLVPVSEWLAKIISKSYMREYPIKTIYNGIDTNIFKPRSKNKIRNKYNLDNKFLILGVAGVWDRRKGLEDFMQLNTLLKENEKIILLGLNSNQIKALPDKILGIERTEDVDELAELYTDVDVFLNPTWEDNFPTTNLEAMACGTPVITYNTGGSPEAISTDTGFVVKKGDLNEIRRIIDIIKCHGKLSYTKMCRNHAVSFYNKNDRFAEYFELYQSIIHDKLL